MMAWISVCVKLCLILLSSSVPETKGEVSQVCSCASDADGGCVPNQLCAPNDNCFKENVAYGKPAWMSSRWVKTTAEGERVLFPPACAAVNGRTGHLMRRLDQDGTNCVVSALEDREAWWKVDLGQRYTITHLTVYSRETQVKRMAGFWIYVDGAICKKLPFLTYHYPLVATITCDRPLRGQVVTMAKKGKTQNDEYIINFCEVQIWVCRAGRYGRNCSQTCHCHNNLACDNHYGTCYNGGCEAGYHGDDCSERCGQCADSGLCDQRTGHCVDGCQYGYQPPLCTLPCQEGTYGENCREACGHCQNSAACDVFSGSCPACEGNFSLPLCKDDVEDGGAVSLAGPVTGALFGGFCLGAVCILLVVWLYRHRAAGNKFTGENQSATFDNPQAPGTEDQTPPPPVTLTPTTDDVTQLEQGQYASLQDPSDYLTPYNAPVYVYDNTNA